MRRLILLLTATLLPGCILDAETCGEGFVLVGDRCVVPAGASGLGSLAGDVTLVTEGWQDLAAATNPTLRISDGSQVERGRLGQPLAGADIDAVLVTGVDLQANGVKVLATRYSSAEDVAPPDPQAALGPADWDGGEAGLLWLGGSGQVEIAFSLSRALLAGDRIAVLEADELGGGDDFYSVELCDPLGGGLGASCVILGTGGPGSVTFELR